MRAPKRCWRTFPASSFKPRDIKVLLSNHEHFDHVGGMARLRQATGAKVLASPVAASVLRTGKDSAEDPQAGIHKPMRPVAKVSLLRNGQAVGVGPLAPRPVFTPGHTPRRQQHWRWQSCEGADCKTIVYADIFSPVSRDDSLQRPPRLSGSVPAFRRPDRSNRLRYPDRPPSVGQFDAGPAARRWLGLGRQPPVRGSRPHGSRQPHAAADQGKAATMSWKLTALAPRGVIEGALLAHEGIDWDADIVISGSEITGPAR